MDAASLTQALYNAFCTNKPLDMKACSGVLNDYESAYAVQRKFAELKGEPTGGYKISLTSKTTQDMFGTTEPLFGEQTKSHIFAAPCTLELDHMNEPLIEVELSMIPKVDLTSSMSDEELLENITVAGGIEVPDARFEAWFPTLNKYLVVADCAVGGCIIHGTPVDGKTLTVAGLNAIHPLRTLQGRQTYQGRQFDGSARQSDPRAQVARRRTRKTRPSAQSRSGRFERHLLCSAAP